jgi:hypothetical protein
LGSLGIFPGKQRRDELQMPGELTFCARSVTVDAQNNVMIKVQAGNPLFRSCGTSQLDFDGKLVIQ